MYRRTGIEKSFPQPLFAQCDNDRRIRAGSKTTCVVCNLGQIRVWSFDRADYPYGIPDAYIRAEASNVDLLKGEQLCR